jgi:ferric-chelate reductase
MGFQAIHAAIKQFPDAENGDVLRLDFEHSQDPWKIGQHFYLCFTNCSIWQSHPFTPLSLPTLKDGKVTHSYILRAKQGETKKLAELVRKGLVDTDTVTTPVILSGPYGESITRNLTPEMNLLCVAGGTGITYILPVLLNLISQQSLEARKVQLMWAVRNESDTKWVQEELQSIYRASGTNGISMLIYVTREAGPPEAAGGGEQSNAVDKLEETGSSPYSASLASGDLAQSWMGSRIRTYGRQPDLKMLLPSFIGETIRGPTRVIASGPGSMISDLRSAVATSNSGTEVWKGNDRFDVSLLCDNRLEY